MTHYIHHINPVMLHIWGPLSVRWYGISYLLGFIAAIFLLRHWSKKGEFDVPEKEVNDFIVSLALFGVFMGGRIGYVLLYGWDTFIHDPLYIFKVWEGGMASHGGLVGTILFMFWYAKKKGYSFWNLTDNMACTASLGIAFGRLANFINGELWGRVTNVSWAMYFPEKIGMNYENFNRPMIEELIRRGDLLPRHPSQLYQALAEGFLVFIFMLLIRRTGWGKRPAALSISFLVLYAIARIGMEFFREPDSTIYFGWLTKGQLYSILMLVGALIIYLTTQRKSNKSVEKAT